MVEKAKNTKAAFLNFDLEQTAMPEEIKVNKDEPEVELEIEHVYGYRTSDCVQNLRYSAEGKAVFMVASLGVIMDTDSLEQSFYGGK